MSKTGKKDKQNNQKLSTLPIISNNFLPASPKHKMLWVRFISVEESPENGGCGVLPAPPIFRYIFHRTA